MEIIAVPVHADEYDSLKRLAEAQNLTAGEFVRMALGWKPFDAVPPSSAAAYTRKRGRRGCLSAVKLGGPASE